MFTGIITHIGRVEEKTSSTLRVSAPEDLMKQLSLGCSIALNGVCFTVANLDSGVFTVDFMPETEKRTNLSAYRQGTYLNLELPATGATFLSGHIVQGHVDGVATLTDIREDGESRILTFALPEGLEKYLVEKGSIAINGISLTVITPGSSFTVGIIPHTWEYTVLAHASLGDLFNIEVDVLAKYVERLLNART